MDGKRIDAWARARNALPSRRGVLGGLAGGAFALVAARLPGLVEERKQRRKRHKRNTKHARRNAFGCLDVGQACRGDDKKCCSGRCAGTKPKKGKKDSSRCVAHDTGGCQAGLDACGAAPVACTTSTGVDDGRCFSTTGNAGYCSSDSFCAACRRDADCQGAYGPRAACAVCASCEHGTVCVQPDDVM